jgi:PAS domain S-box-containing protein
MIQIDDNFNKIYGNTQGNYQIEFNEFIKFIHPQDVDIIKTNIEEGIKSDKNMDFEFRIIRPDGNIRNIRSYGKIVKDKTNKPQKFIGINIDISYLKKAELALKENEEKLQNSYNYARSLLEASLDPLVTIDVDGKITDVNSATENATGLLRDSLIGTDFSDYFTEPDKARIGYQKVFSEGTVIDYPLTIRHKSNKLIDVLYNASVYKNENGEIIGVFAAARDITKIKQTEKVLEIANNELSLQIEQKAKQAEELIIANKELEYQKEEKQKRADELVIANKELEMFSYSVSHDLRAPLRHINGYVDLLLNRFYDSLPEKARHYLDTIADSSRQMGTLIDDLLQFSRIGRQEMRLADFDMNIVINEVLVSIKQDNQERNIEWHIAKLPRVYADKAMLQLVWTNLLINAVKFTSTREKAIIEINVLDENDEHVFSVHDNGVGFDMQYSHKLFGVFQRLHSTTEFEGTGIGLANVQHIISRHSGRIWAEAEPDKGATFYFSLPKDKEN